MSPGNVEDRPPEVRVANPPVERVGRTMEKLLDTADVAKVFGEPIAHGQMLLIPAAEIVAVAGVGMGSGGAVGFGKEQGQRSRGSGGGGGGGGKTLARSVAVIVVSPDGVEVRPVFDWTKIALAAFTAAGFIVASWKGMKRGGR
ncbi:MAG TPA: hypothetical protein VGQ32_09385 [Thermoanaerobaculia bacterium]|jgi:uncharacterized spore protein YtfJ|nr:hypothetical protein [Thermoanaerobaculia bacterium]